MADKYNWNFCSLGGVTRVVINNGEDIAHLRELDQKLWTALSCPTNGLEFDPTTLRILDGDGDGKIRVQEVIATAEWLTSIIKDKDSILKGEDSLPLDQFNTENGDGAKLHNSAAQILRNLGLEKDSISISDTADSIAIFKNTRFNGDGIITPATAEEDSLKATITNAIDTIGGVQDKCGEAGIDTEILEKFYTACADYSEWKKAAEDNADCLPFNAATDDAFNACEGLKSKIADFFMRCKLVKFNSGCEDTIGVSAEKIGTLTDKNLSECSDQIAEYPLASPNKEGLLHFDAINPAWQPAFAKLQELVLNQECKGKGKGKDSISETEWLGILAKFEPYAQWKAAVKGTEVESLGLERVREILKESKKQALLDLIGQDLALKEEADSIDEVDKLLHLYRDFYAFLRNFVSFTDLYSLDTNVKAMFQAGELYIDQRCCRLCVKVDDLGKHADMASLGGMFLLYCNCTSKVRPESFNIAAVMTDGGIKNLRVGTNAIFYDREGNDWDATVIKIVDNPISIRQAFWSPYRKFANFVSEKINKSASEKENAVMADMQAKADATPLTAEGVASTAAEAANKKPPFDIAKFAGIFAAIGMALGYIGAFLTKVVDGATANPLGFIILLVVIMLCISGPSCFIAWSKLRKRNLGPILNANGWAINSVVLINIIFGKTLTSTAKFPVIKGKDPFVIKTPWWKKVLRWIIVLAIVLGGAYLANRICTAKKAKAQAAAEVEMVAAQEAEAAEAVEEAETEAPAEEGPAE